ncbi:hypothetical protein KP79_PYT18144 [Mizuhopecten yessoensis]|uniref:Uncharacterized protein n=1 Tax=Mizuhopecten yessoensis TaxID=6573 RepID=A0A210R557_MIZYE|nr:hypothetical protein KP79_PYT18144 [Mizuhopecten yessoensis]
MAKQSVPTFLLLFILAVTVAHGHTNQEPHQDGVGHVTRDEVTKDMYNTLMERLERQEASLW